MLCHSEPCADLPCFKAPSPGRSRLCEARKRRRLPGFSSTPALPLHLGPKRPWGGVHRAPALASRTPLSTPSTRNGPGGCLCSDLSPAAALPSYCLQCSTKLLRKPKGWGFQGAGGVSWALTTWLQKRKICPLSEQVGREGKVTLWPYSQGSFRQHSSSWCSSTLLSIVLKWREGGCLSLL